MINLKYPKVQKKPIKGTKFIKKTLNFGTYGIQVCENGEITFNQLLSIKKRLSLLGKTFKYWSTLPVKTPKTTKALGSRMGSGKGEIFTYIFKLVKGAVIFEWSGNDFSTQTMNLFRVLPLKVRLIKKSL